MIKYLKRKIAYIFYMAKLLKHSQKGSIDNLRNAKKIIFTARVNDTLSFRLLSDFSKELSSYKISVNIFVLCSEDNLLPIRADAKNLQNLTLISEKELNWLGFLSKKKMENVKCLKDDYDTLIAFSSGDDISITNLALRIRTGFKIGPYSKEYFKAFDFMINNIKNEISGLPVSTFIDNVKHYFNILIYKTHE